MYCQSSYYLHGVNDTHWECLVNRLFISMLSMVLIGSVLSIVYLSPWCQWYSLGVPWQSPIYLNGVNGTHLECIVKRLFIFMVSMVLIGSVLSITFLSPLCRGYSLGVPCQSSVYLHGVNGTHCVDYLSPWCHGYSLVVPCQSSCQWLNYLHGVTATHWNCLVIRLIISMVSMVFIGSVL